MGVCGTYAQSFNEANLASCVNISLDAGYRHVFFDVVSVSKKKVKLMSHGDGTFIERVIKMDKDGQQYVTITQQCSLGMALGIKPAKHKILPFIGERI